MRAVQVEVTSRCTRRCAVCPRSALSRRWRDGDLGLAAWSGLLPGLSRVAHVHLQGWGEPLLHPDLPAMASAAAAMGCTVGITTNGDLLDEAEPWLLEGPVSLVTVSVAGTSLQPALRDGSRFGEVVARAGRLAARGRRGLRVRLSYLLTRDNAGELAAAVVEAARHGLRDVVVNHLDVTPTRELLDRAAFTDDGLRPGVAEALDRAAAAARTHRVRLRLPATRPQELLVCALDPTRFLFVACDGRVGPCVQLLLPIEGLIPRAGVGGVAEVEPERFGRLPADALPAILAGDARRRFVSPFEERLEAERAFLEEAAGVGLGVAALERLRHADRDREEALRRAPLPAGCAGCHQSAGW